MRKQLMLLVVPLCAVAIAAGVATAAPDSSLQARGPKLDKLHAERPTAALGKPELLQLEMFRAAADYTEGLARLDAFYGAVHDAAVQHWIEILQEIQAARAAAASRAPSGRVGSSSNPGGFLSCVRNRESG